MNIQFNQKDAIEVLTVEEAAILDMLVSKVQDHTAKKELQNSFNSKSKMIEELAKQNGYEVIKMSIPTKLPDLQDYMGMLKMNDKDINNVEIDITSDVDINQLFKDFSNHPFLLRILLDKFQ